MTPEGANREPLAEEGDQQPRDYDHHERIAILEGHASQKFLRQFQEIALTRNVVEVSD